MYQLHYRKTFITLLLVSIITLIFTPTIGAHHIVLSHLLNSESPTDTMIFWQLRVPRVLLSFSVGAMLAVCGMCFQALFRNPLATPYTLGVSTGAAFGASLAITLGININLPGLDAPILFSFLGALGSMALVYTISLLKRSLSTSTLLLAGISVNLFFSSCILFLQYSADFIDSFKIVRWLMGGLDTVGYQSLWLLLPFLVLGSLALFLFSRELNLLATGEEFAISRGVNAQSSKLIVFCVTSIMVGACVSISGPIGFIGMMAPHICRLLIGNDHKLLAPASFLFGGTFLTLCDTASRIIIAPAEMPVGIITALLGGPFFIWLLLTRHNESRI